MYPSFCNSTKFKQPTWKRCMFASMKYLELECDWVNIKSKFRQKSIIFRWYQLSLCSPRAPSSKACQWRTSSCRAWPWSAQRRQSRPASPRPGKDASLNYGATTIPGNRSVAPSWGIVLLILLVPPECNSSVLFLGQDLGCVRFSSPLLFSKNAKWDGQGLLFWHLSR